MPHLPWPTGSGYRAVTRPRNIECLDLGETARRPGTSEAVTKTRPHLARQTLLSLLAPRFGPLRSGATVTPGHPDPAAAGPPAG